MSLGALASVTLIPLRALHIPALILTFPITACPVGISAIAMVSALAMWLLVSALPVLAVGASQQSAPVHALARNARLPIKWAFTICSAALCHAVVAVAFFIFVAHEGDIATWLIKVINDISLFA